FCGSSPGINSGEPELAARGHNVVRVKVPFQCTQDGHLLLTKVILHPGPQHTAHTMVVTQCSAVFYALINDAALECDVLFNVHACDEDEIKIGPLRVKVRGMGHAHGVGTALDEGTYPFMQTMQFVPRDTCFQRVDQDAII